MPIDCLTPLRIAHAGAKRLGLSEQIVTGALSYLHSERFKRRSFQGYEAGPQDVFAATYLKSGTNWSMQIALQIAWRGRAEFAHIHDLVAWPDSPDPHAVVPVAEAAPWTRSPTGMRVVKTHLAPAYVPWSPGAKYLIVLRDPKEVLVSAYHFATRLLGVSDTVSPARFLQIYLGYSRRYGNPWLDHALAWWQLRDRANVLVLQYAEMTQDLGRTVDHVAGLMGVSLTSAERSAVIERSGLRWMKSHNHKFEPLESPFADPNEPAVMVRRGVSGGSDELYSPQELAAVDQAVLAELPTRGVDFPYQRLFPMYAA